MNILIIGATSMIAQATTRIYASQGNAHFFLLARDVEKLKILADDLTVRGAALVATQPFDANDFSSHAIVIERAIDTLGTIDSVLIAYGTLCDQHACERDANLMLHEMNNNALSVMSLLTHLAHYFEARGTGTIAVISSVAGDRGRGSNYVYGTAKGALTLFLQGLRNRLYKKGVHVLTIKPGFVDTPMTMNFMKSALWAQPKNIARDIVRAIEKKTDVLYTPWFWRIIMGIIILIPETIFKRMKL
jgi:short-subunit dehydrogenase